MLSDKWNICSDTLKYIADGAEIGDNIYYVTENVYFLWMIVRNVAATETSELF
jgi:hypothetical protein